MTNTLGICKIDYKKSTRYHVDGNWLECNFMGGHWTYPNIIVQEYNKNTKEYIIEIEYYADSTYLFRNNFV